MALREFDRVFHTKLRSWTRLRSPYYSQFSPEEVDILRRAESSMASGGRRIAFLCFENTFAELGGLAAVTRHLPAAIRKAGEELFFFSPFYKNNADVNAAVVSGRLKKVAEGVGRPGERGEVLHFTCYRDTADTMKSYYVDVDGRFAAELNPYDYADQHELLDDSLAFCAVLPRVLAQLAVDRNIVFHAHDWETAPIAVAAKLAVISGVLKSAKCLLTLHNSFDAGLPDSALYHYLGRGFEGETVLQICIPFLDGPLSTVSTPFAHELVHDPIQTGFFANHLREAFRRNPPVGIENGSFRKGKHPFSKSALEEARRGNFTTLLKEKAHARREFVRIIKRQSGAACLGGLDFSTGSRTAPIFFMTGRFDNMQKGFDIVFRAFSRLKRGTAKLFFSPSMLPGQAREALALFADLCERCPGDIAIWPFRIQRDDYDRLLRGATYLVMPSFYEPFGALTEGYANGTPVIARACGGALAQVTPHRPEAIPGGYRHLFGRTINTSAPTGILFREHYPDHLASGEWARLLMLPPERREEVGLYMAMVEAACQALRTACDVTKRPEQYAQFIVNGRQRMRLFGWPAAVRKYRALYDVACEGDAL